MTLTLKDSHVLPVEFVSQIGRLRARLIVNNNHDGLPPLCCLLGTFCHVDPFDTSRPAYAIKLLTFILILNQCTGKEQCMKEMQYQKQEQKDEDDNMVEKEDLEGR